MAAKLRATPHDQVRRRNSFVVIGRAQLTPSRPDTDGRYVVTDWFIVLVFPLIPLGRLYISNLEPTWKRTTTGPRIVEWMQVHGRLPLSAAEVLRAVLVRWVVAPAATILVALPFVWLLERPDDTPTWLFFVAIFGVSLLPIMAYLLVMALSEQFWLPDYDVELSR